MINMTGLFFNCDSFAYEIKLYVNHLHMWIIITSHVKLMNDTEMNHLRDQMENR